MSGYPSISAFIAWVIVGLCWIWLVRSSRKRSSIIQRLSLEYSGFIRKRFFLPTLSLEPVDMAWTRIVAGEPIRMYIRYELPLVGLSSFPQTIFEFETMEALYGPEGMSYSGSDLASGRGLFLGGTNLTEDFRKFGDITPHITRFRLGWKGSRVWLAVPGLLDSRDEVWIRHFILFMEEVAGRVLNESKGVNASVNRGF